MGRQLRLETWETGASGDSPSLGLSVLNISQVYDRAFSNFLTSYQTFPAKAGRSPKAIPSFKLPQSHTQFSLVLFLSPILAKKWMHILFCSLQRDRTLPAFVMEGRPASTLPYLSICLSTQTPLVSFHSGLSHVLLGKLLLLTSILFQNPCRSFKILR